MLVKNWMNKLVITVDLTDSMLDAINLIKEHNIRMLPVTEKGNLVGVVSDRDLKKASASDATLLEEHDIQYLISKIKIKDIKILSQFHMILPSKRQRKFYYQTKYQESLLPMTTGNLLA